MTTEDHVDLLPPAARQGYRGTGHAGRAVDRNPGAERRVPADPRGEGWRLRAMSVGWSLGWEVARRVPEAIAFAVAEVAAAWLVRRDATPVRRLRANLARVVAARDLPGATAAAVRSYARYWVEAFRAADLDAVDLDRRTTTNGFEHVDRALEGGRGVIVLLAHHGSWDVAARWAETHGYHLAVVAEVVRPRRLFRRFVRLRETIGLEVVPLGRSTGADRLDRLVEVLQANHLVGLLAERDLTGSGPVVDLFGESARIPAGPVALARRSGAPIVPVTMLQRPGRRWHVEALPPVALGDDASAPQRVADALEALIRCDPVQWHAVQPVWLADQPAHRRAANRAGENAATA